jgi:hypothetical protein
MTTEERVANEEREPVPPTDVKQGVGSEDRAEKAKSADKKGGVPIWASAAVFVVAYHLAGKLGLGWFATIGVIAGAAALLGVVHEIDKGLKKRRGTQDN